MKKILITILLTLLSINGVTAQLLWKVEETGAMIFGTHHLAPATMTDSVKGLRAAIESADLVIGEVDDRLMTDPAVMSRMAAQFMAPADSTLSKLLTDEQLDSLNTVLSRYTGGMLTAAAVDAMKPGAVATQLAMFVAMEVCGPISDQLDMSVQRQARERAIATAAFETPEEQIKMLLGDPLADQAVSLMKSVRGVLDGSAKKETEELYKAYMAQNLPAIEQVMFDSESMSATEEARLITERNRRWVDKLNGLMDKQKVLLVVGVGHLPGPNGLISLLRQNNLTITPYGN